MVSYRMSLLDCVVLAAPAPAPAPALLKLTELPAEKFAAYAADSEVLLGGEAVAGDCGCPPPMSPPPPLPPPPCGFSSLMCGTAALPPEAAPHLPEAHMAAE